MRVAGCRLSMCSMEIKGIKLEVEGKLIGVLAIISRRAPGIAPSISDNSRGKCIVATYLFIYLSCLAIIPQPKELQHQPLPSMPSAHTFSHPFQLHHVGRIFAPGPTLIARCFRLRRRWLPLTRPRAITVTCMRRRRRFSDRLPIDNMRRGDCCGLDYHCR